MKSSLSKLRHFQQPYMNPVVFLGGILLLRSHSVGFKNPNDSLEEPRGSNTTWHHILLSDAELL